jgi:hypothetical protein
MSIVLVWWFPSKTSPTVASINLLPGMMKSSHAVYLDLEVFVFSRRTSWVRSSLYAVSPVGPGFDFEVFRLKTRVFEAIDTQLPHPWARLQSVTTVASR